ncbi:MAG: hypothetical protein OEM15_19065 [Myxococcales bacterium]|nr:hypothetical protein [Myxococcales bacterium]MDH3486348.1 hypothetical protein [Myxococcales bacterium]
MARHGRHGANALCDLGEVCERGMAQVSEREVPRPLLSDHQGGGLSQGPAVVIAAKDEALGRGDGFELGAGKRCQFQSPRFALFVDVRSDPDLMITEAKFGSHLEPDGLRERAETYTPHYD